MRPPNDSSSADFSSLVTPAPVAGQGGLLFRQRTPVDAEVRLENSVFLHKSSGGFFAGKKSERRQNIEFVVRGPEAQYSEK